MLSGLVAKVNGFVDFEMISNDLFEIVSSDESCHKH